jgi:hypothetical protein
MMSMDSPAALAAALRELFPAFAGEIEGDDLTSYHEVVQRLAPRITGYLQAAPERRTAAFCKLVDELVAAGGDRENAISTCLLEHASQLGLEKTLRPHLGAAARQELR